jgi:beta-glucosidase
MRVFAEPLYRDAGATVADRVADLLERMSLDEKLGQMTQIDQRYLRDNSDLATWRLGSVFFGGGSTPATNDAAAWADAVDGFQRAALATPLGIPLLVGADAVHGHNNLHGATIYPHNVGLGAVDDADLLLRIGQALATEVVATGPRWTFAPCVAVARNERWGRTYESAGEDPALASTMARMVTGIQGETLGRGPTSILATLKHYVGDGGTTGGVDRGDTELSEEKLRELHLAPYVVALEAGAGSVMISYSSWNGLRAHAHHYLITEVLKGELGFDGFVVSDWAGIDDIDGEAGFSSTDVVTAVNAGIDMIMVPERHVELLALLTQEVESGAVARDRIDDAVCRILTKKFELGLFEDPFARRIFAGEIRGDAHRALAREAAARSLVLLKNDGDLLPLRRTKLKLFVAGKNADDVGHQCGGWTITWQGGSGATTPGTSILAGIREVAGAGTTVDFDAGGAGAEGHDVAVVVIGEAPYAEFFGDRPEPQELGLDDDDLAVLARVRASGVPVVAVLVSGRPLIVTEQLPDWQALVAAWLPGTEGGGVADVLFGVMSPTGKLPHTWPRDAAQIPINVGDPEYDPLFTFGFGLTYA